MNRHLSKLSGMAGDVLGVGQAYPPMSPAFGTEMDRATLVAIRQRVIEMYESCSSFAKRCERLEDGAGMAGDLHEQSFGMRKVRMMLGRMLDEQAGFQIPSPPEAPMMGAERRVA